MHFQIIIFTACQLAYVKSNLQHVESAGGLCQEQTCELKAPPRAAPNVVLHVLFSLMLTPSEDSLWALIYFLNLEELWGTADSAHCPLMSALVLPVSHSFVSHLFSNSPLPTFVALARLPWIQAGPHSTPPRPYSDWWPRRATLTEYATLLSLYYANSNGFLATLRESVNLDQGYTWSQTLDY
jgi:hypothetical protein